MLKQDENVKINITLQNKGNLLAKAVISLNTIEFGFVTIKGFQIWKSKVFNERLQEAIYIQPTIKLAYGHAYPQVFFENNQKWLDLEMKIYETFIEERSNSQSKMNTNRMEENVDIEKLEDDLPF